MEVSQLSPLDWGQGDWRSLPSPNLLPPSCSALLPSAYSVVRGDGDGQMCSVAFIARFQRGTGWVATGKVTQKVPADFPGPDQPSVH